MCRNEYEKLPLREVGGPHMMPCFTRLQCESNGLDFDKLVMEEHMRVANLKPGVY